MPKIIRVDPLQPGWGPVRGTIVPVALDCGHVFQGNPTMDFRVGTYHQCHDCDQKENRRTMNTVDQVKALAEAQGATVQVRSHDWGQSAMLSVPAIPGTKMGFVLRLQRDWGEESVYDVLLDALNGSEE